MNISRNVSFLKQKHTYIRVWTRESVWRIISQVRTLGYHDKAKAKRPSKSTFLPISPIFATKLKNGDNHTRHIPRAVQNCRQKSWVGTTTPNNSQEGFAGFGQTRDEINK